MSSTISHHSALIYTMVLVSAADRNMTDNEIATMGEIVRSLPIFRNYDFDLLATAAQTCAELLDAEEGLETALALIREALQAHADWLREDDRLPERRRRGLEQRLQRLFVSRVADHFLERAGERLRTAAAEVCAGGVSVETAAARLAKEFEA